MDTPVIPAPASGDPGFTWSDRPSQLLNLGRHLIALAILAIAIAAGSIPLADRFTGIRSIAQLVLGGLAVLWAWWSWLTIRTIAYRVVRQHLELTTGILARHTEVIALYRIRDIAVRRPFLLRLAGLGDIVLISNDRTAPEVALRGLRRPLDLMRDLRDEVERSRSKARVMGVEADQPTGGETG